MDLVTVASAVHWFDLNVFYRELGRVLRPGGVIAVWTYHVAHADAICGELLWTFYQDVVRPYFSPGARLVDERYAGIRLPGTSIEAGEFWMDADWNCNQLLTFVRSWSGTQKYIERHGNDPTDFLRHDLTRLFPKEDVKQRIRWPIYLKLSRL
jgi:SAM-dependent methyltransferase